MDLKSLEIILGYRRVQFGLCLINSCLYLVNRSSPVLTAICQNCMYQRPKVDRSHNRTRLSPTAGSAALWELPPRYAWVATVVLSLWAPTVPWTPQSLGYSWTQQIHIKYLVFHLLNCKLVLNLDIVSDKFCLLNFVSAFIKKGLISCLPINIFQALPIHKSIQIIVFTTKGLIV